MENKEFFAALTDLVREKGISEEAFIETLQNALASAYKKQFDGGAEISVTLDPELGTIEFKASRYVVEEVVDKDREISLEDAQELDPAHQVGDVIENVFIPKNFGRIAAQTAKQVIVQKLREAERDIIFTEFNDRKGEIVSGIIQKADKNIVVMDLGRLEGIMPTKEQMPTEKYSVNDKIKGYVLDVERGEKGAPQVIVSRSHPDFVRKLLEFEIPEIYEGLIEIKSVSRDPGYRSKVAVYSQNPDIDPVGSCVGQRGIRIQNVINELNGEKIDVIEWDADPATFISASLLPAKILAVDIKEEEKFAQVIVPDDQLSLAIGKSGQNVRLAAKLTNWKIDIKSETQFREMLTKNSEVNSESEGEVEESETEV